MNAAAPKALFEVNQYLLARGWKKVTHEGQACLRRSTTTADNGYIYCYIQDDLDELLAVGHGSVSDDCWSGPKYYDFELPNVRLPITDALDFAEEVHSSYTSHEPDRDSDLVVADLDDNDRD